METEKSYFFDKPDNVKRLLRGFYVSCVVLLLLDLVIHRHVMHSWENLLGFYPLYGFVGCVILVLIARWMRTFLMRDEDYYEKIEAQLYKESGETIETEKEESKRHVDG
jgi:anaerobic C4-dicarboxylate transporter